MAYTFSGIGSGFSLDTSGWNTWKVTDMTSMLFEAGSTSPSTASWNTASVTTMTGLFSHSITTPDVSNWNLWKVLKNLWLIETL